MPIFHIQSQALVEQPDGSKNELPPALGLQQRGSCIPVSVGLEQNMAQVLIQANKPVPAAIQGLALIDTGASVSCVDSTIAATLKLPIVGTANMASASHANTSVSLHPIQITLQNQAISFNASRAMSANIANQGFIAIIGRDILQLCTLFYNGPTGQITLAL